MKLINYFLQIVLVSVLSGFGNLNGQELVWSTYIGGNAKDEPGEIVVDDAGNVYISGTTNSTDFPTTPNAYDRTIADFLGATSYGDVERCYKG